jgi:uracil-DNA glycosylase
MNKPSLQTARPLDDPALAFAELIHAAQACRRCPRMEGRRRVLSPANGPLTARVLFVAEAPGRFGADASGVPLSGDRTGRTFEELLAVTGLSRGQVFITNAVLCNPRDEAGRNDRPSRQEIANCGDYLMRLIEILQPAWVATLGAVALDAALRIEPHGLVLARDAGRAVRWFGRWLVPLYHPGPRALIHRPLGLQRVDYAGLASMTAAPSASRP